VNDELSPEGRRQLSPILTKEEFQPLSATVKVEIGSASHAGKAKAFNEDHYLVLRLARSQETLATSLSAADLPSHFDEFGYGMLVADGLGGRGEGAAASRIAVSTMAHLLLHYGHWNLRVDSASAVEIVDRAHWFYQQIHDAVVLKARTAPGLADMATTMTAAYSAGDEMFLTHVGHSRAYLFRDGDLTQLTRNQTVSQRFADGGTGPMGLRKATEDLKHILTDTLGGRVDGPLVDIEHFRLWDGDQVMLCSDGLTSMVSDERIADVLSLRRNSEEQCNALVEAALDAGGNDNVTVVVAQYQIPKS